MSTFQKMKENMILNQFLPGLVKNEDLLKVFKEIDRENFLDKEYKHLAYSDLHIKLSNFRHLISPFSFAKILDKAHVDTKDVVLLIGSGSGYESAILSKVASTIMAIEEDLNLHNKAEIELANNLIENVVNIKGSFLKGCKKYAPYDIIIVLGSLNKPSEEILSQLSNNGKLLICENYGYNLEESRLFMYTMINKKVFKEYICDLNIPRLIAEEINTNSFSL